MIVIEIPSDPEALNKLTCQAIENAKAGHMTAISALLDYKIFPNLTELINKDLGGGDWKDGLLLKTWETVMYEILHGEIAEANAYSQLTRLVNQALCSELYNRFSTKIYAYIYRRTSDTVESEELTSNTFVKMLNAIEEGKSWKSSFSGWLYRIAHNLVIDHYRARDRQKSISIDDVAQRVDPNNNPVKAAELALDMDALRSCMARLTDEQSRVIELRYLQGYSFNDIAEEMDKTEGAVKALLHRGLETLRALLKNDVYTDTY